MPAPQMFDWLKKIFGGQPAPPPRPPALPPAPARPRPSAYQPKPTPAPPPRPARAPTARENKTLDLSPGLFAPLSPEQIRAQAQGMAPSFLFGRRNRIPPVTDPRTLLIDRAMVAQGLITPEQLGEIHRTGEEMEKSNPDPVLAEYQARQAVQLDREERAALKARKKAEAAVRDAARAKAVADRKANDIIFLGRGVSKGLADRRANIEKLAAAGLPPLATPADVAAALQVSIPTLRWLAFHADAAATTHYVRFTVPKRSGGTRELAAPHEQIAAAQLWILENILEKVPTHAAAHGFVGGRSTVTNARPHVGRQVVVNADLKDFFPSISFPRVAGLFRHLGFSPAAATILGLLCTECPRRTVVYAGKTYHVATGPRSLPQGACTSPALSNLIARGMDRRLSGIAAKLGWTYTRYADDLTFSADGEPAGKVGYLLARLRHIAQDEGFAVNEKKTRIQRRNMCQSVTGVVVNQRPGVDRALVRRLRAILHQAAKTGLEAQNRERLPHFSAWLAGMINYINGVNPAQAQPLLEALGRVSGNT
jgi:RNA-directed DNA polymerase